MNYKNQEMINQEMINLKTEMRNMTKMMADLNKNDKAKQRLAFLDYLQCFVDEDGFEGKRFERYLLKTSEFIIKEVLSRRYKHAITQAHQFIDYILWILFNQKENKDEFTMAFLSNHLVEINEFLYLPVEGEDDNLFENFDRWCSLNGQNYAYSISDVSKHNFKEACKEHIKRKVLNGEDINASNYFRTIPATISEGVLILRDSIVWSILDMENLLYGTHQRNKELSLDVNKKLMDQIDEQKQIIENLQKELTKIKTERNSLDSEPPPNEFGGLPPFRGETIYLIDTAKA